MPRRFRALALVCLLAGATASVASEAPPAASPAGTSAASPGLPPDAPTEAAVRELLVASDARQMLDATVTEMRRSVDSTLASAMESPELNDAQRQIVAQWKEDFIGLLTGYLDWKELEPLFVDIYRRSFTREEVDSLVAFYRTPGGRALVSKMPLVMQNSMTAMQGRMAELQPRMQKLQSELQTKLMAAGTPP